MAVALGLLGALGLHLYLRRYEAELAGGPRRPVVMATRDLALGEIIERSALDVKELPERYIEERHIEAQDLERVLGARVTSTVHGGGALLWSDLDTAQEGRALAGLVRVGMRAFALPEQDLGFGGLLRPGDRVDVVFAPVPSGPEAQVLISNALVLTVGGNLGQGEEGAQWGDRVTLSVSPEQANLLTQREGLGRLRLALRNPEDALVAWPGRGARAAAELSQGEARAH
jgi:pilus assembly protein CpaB